jgi:hypothetical protein
MSRYVYEVQPYHTVRELEMDRIMKNKYQQKFFSKREKKPEDLPTSRKLASRRNDVIDAVPTPTPKIASTNHKDELSVPEHEPFKKAFAVNGHGYEELNGHHGGHGDHQVGGWIMSGERRAQVEALLWQIVMWNRTD